MSFADMDLTAVDTTMRELGATAEDYGTTWRAHRRALAGHATALGTGALALAFRPGYRKVDESLRAAAEIVPLAYQRLAKAGTDSVTDYRIADEASARHFPKR